MSRKQKRPFGRPNQETTNGTLRKVIVTANLLIALASGGFAVAALVNPASLLLGASEVTTAVSFYASYYAARSLPLTAFIVVLGLSGSTNWLGAFLIFAGLVQAGDALVATDYGGWEQILLPAVAAVVHLFSARWLLRSSPQPWRN